MVKILGIMQAYLRLYSHVKVHRNAFIYAAMTRVKVKRWLGGGEPSSGKKVIKPGRTDFQTLVPRCSYPSYDFTAEGQSHHELNCSLVPG